MNFIWLMCLLFLTTESTIPRTNDEPDLIELVKRVMIGPYTIDPAFTSFIAHPSSYYTDLYGIHALKDFTSQKIIDDFTPDSAEILFQNDTILQLKFHTGWNATFHPHSAIVIRNATSPTDHVYIGGDNARELIANLMEFHEILKRNHLESTYLIPNPHYDMEKIVNVAYYSGRSTVNVTLDPTMAQFQSSTNALLIYPDPVHGDLSWFMQFMHALNTSNLDWLGMEMLPSSMQTTLDSFCTAPTSSAEYIEARTNLTSYFLTAWTPYFHLNITSGEDSPYFKAIDLIRMKNGRVYGMDMNDMNFLLFRYGESDFGASVRSLN